MTWSKLAPGPRTTEPDSDIEAVCSDWRSFVRHIIRGTKAGHRVLKVSNMKSIMSLFNLQHDA